MNYRCKKCGRKFENESRLKAHLCESDDNKSLYIESSSSSPSVDWSTSYLSDNSSPSSDSSGYDYGGGGDSGGGGSSDSW